MNAIRLPESFRLPTPPRSISPPAKSTKHRKSHKYGGHAGMRPEFAIDLTRESSPEPDYRDQRERHRRHYRRTGQVAIGKRMAVLSTLTEPRPPHPRQVAARNYSREISIHESDTTAVSKAGPWRQPVSFCTPNHLALPPARPKPKVSASKQHPTESTYRPSKATPAQMPVQPVPRFNRCVIVSQPNKGGKGIAATQAISRGELIMVEEPFPRVFHPCKRDEVMMSLEHMDPRKAELFWQFTGTIREIVDRCENIAETNTIPLHGSAPEADESDDDPRTKGRWGYPSGMFEHLSRVNHSCSPNARWFWDEQRQVMTLRALTAIENGEEVTCCYIDNAAAPSAERLRDLNKDFDFICKCSCCSMSDTDLSRSDRRRTEFQQLRRDWQETNPDDYAQHVDIALGKLDRALAILRKEGLFGDMAEAWTEKFYVHAAWQNVKEARGAAGEALKWHTVGKGDAAEVEPVAVWAKYPAKWESWGCVEDLLNPSTFEQPSDGEDFVDGYNKMKRQKRQSKAIGSTKRTEGRPRHR